MEELFEHPFYGQEIIRRKEQEYITKILAKYRNEPVNDDLKKKVWDDLQMEKYRGNITIPFRVVGRYDATGKFPNFIEVILDTKV